MSNGDKVYYTGRYKECHGYEYEIVFVYQNGFGLDWWYDLKAVNPDIYTHYPDIYSVEKGDIKSFKNQVNKALKNK